eukprot:TRINITY_DN14908_c0_g2_i1.p1 TRINITY_DN14908_c0_g2~~TRINITY_DN14908_c0_g2_i1.p1  ORF type:complete len:212 (+),score=87.90 TRINITY_DN14908_c0_g2_i1:55-690(+)
MGRSQLLLILGSFAACAAQQCNGEGSPNGLQQSDREITAKEMACPLCVAYVKELSERMDAARPDQGVKNRRKIIRDEARADDLLEATSNALSTGHKFVQHTDNRPALEDDGLAGVFMKHEDLYKMMSSSEASLDIAKQAIGEDYYSPRTAMGCSTLLEEHEDTFLTLITKDAAHDAIYDAVCKPKICSYRIEPLGKATETVAGDAEDDLSM